VLRGSAAGRRRRAIFRHRSTRVKRRAALGAASGALLAPVAVETWAIVVAVIVALTFTSLVAARSAHVSARRMLVRSLVVGTTTMGISYVAGRLPL
jgi:VIT1/CCC1 family predicted Fe2+/Mn2+ transporter